MLSKETLQELSDILREDYGQNYTAQETFEIAHGIVGLFDNLMKFDWKDKNDDEKSELHQDLQGRS